jgi:hypothetical protein
MTTMGFRRAAATAVLASVFLVAGASAALAQATQSADSAAAVAARTGVTYETLLAAMSDVGGRVKDYNATKGKKPEHIQVVDVTTVLGDDHAAYDEARTRYVQFIQYLQGVVPKVTLLRNAATEAKVEPAHVVALDVLADGKIVLFYDTREPAAPAAAAPADSAKTTPAPAPVDSARTAPADSTGNGAPQNGGQ